LNHPIEDAATVVHTSESSMDTGRCCRLVLTIETLSAPQFTLSSIFLSLKPGIRINTGSVYSNIGVMTNSG
jgi:hypothetical protein